MDAEHKLQAAKHALLCGTMTPDEFRKEFLNLPPLPSKMGEALLYPPKTIIVKDGVPHEFVQQPAN